ncbi:type II secretion system protein GspE [Spirochaetia bacterium]|nr:type II secretion system protein GspE [Spirochaetia bacterium]
MNKVYFSPVFCASNGVILLNGTETKTTIGMLNCEDQVLKTRIKKIYAEQSFVFEPISNEDFNLKLSQLYSEENTGAKDLTINPQNDDLRKSAIDHIADDAPVINLLNSIFLEAISRKASDIHIEPYKDDTLIRFRIDGIMIPVRSITADRGTAVSARLKLLANLNVLENRRPQDGHLDIVSANNSFDVRISVSPTIWGESVVLRLLNQSEVPLSLGALGFSQNHLESLKNILSLPAGLVLITGPTGSGKTTTLASILNEINRDHLKIISIEDPVEYRIAGVNQMQINEELGLSFNVLLRRIFRQDPDIIMVGEIRDSETAELAIRSALTGHLVFSTLHTNNAGEAIYRLQNMGIPAYLLSAVLRAVIAQRLVRRVCPACNNRGCEACFKTGYSGRTVISEFLSFSNELSDSIGRGIKPAELRGLLKKENHITLLDDGREKVKAGITTENEIQRELGVG